MDPSNKISLKFGIAIIASYNNIIICNISELFFSL